MHLGARACVRTGASMLTLHLAVLSHESREMMYSLGKGRNRVALGCKFKELLEEHLNIEYWISLRRSQQRLMRRECEGDRIYNRLMFPDSPPTSVKRMRDPSRCSSCLCLVRSSSDKLVQGLCFCKVELASGQGTTEAQNPGRENLRRRKKKRLRKKRRLSRREWKRDKVERERVWRETEQGSLGFREKEDLFCGGGGSQKRVSNITWYERESCQRGKRDVSSVPGVYELHPLYCFPEAECFITCVFLDMLIWIWLSLRFAFIFKNTHKKLPHFI